MLVSSGSILLSQSVNISVNLRQCIIGEEFSNKACVTCSKGQYSVDPTGPCLECLVDAICYGNYSMVPKAGYWRSDLYSTTFYQCPLQEACLGGETNFSLTGRCSEGYWSNLCQSCIQGYSHSSNSICDKCPDMAENIAYLSMIFIIIVLCVCGLVYINISLADKPPSNYTILVKILLNYIQIIAIVASFNLGWPDFALKYLNIQQSAGNLSQQNFSFDCFIAEKYNLSNREVYFDKIILYLLLPVIIIFICLFGWGIMSLIRLDLKYIKNHFVGSVVIILFILHTIIYRISLSPFVCQEIGANQSWLNDDLSILCWDETHKLYTFTIALPGIIIWGLFIPIFGMLLTYKNRNRFDELEIKQRYGFITAGYTSKLYFWEFVIIYRKIFVISCSLFFGSLSVQLQTLSVLTVLLITSYMQATLKPFSSDTLNRIEFGSIISSIITIYCGLYLLTPNVDFNGRIALFIALIFVNSIFFGVWIYVFLKDFTKATIRFFANIIRKKKGTITPEIIDSESEKKEEAYPVINIETNGNNLIEESKESEDSDSQVSYCEGEKIREGKKVNALTAIEHHRHSGISTHYIKPNLRNTVRYNAFNEESYEVIPEDI